MTAESLARCRGSQSVGSEVLGYLSAKGDRRYYDEVTATRWFQREPGGSHWYKLGLPNSATYSTFIAFMNQFCFATRVLQNRIAFFFRCHFFSRSEKKWHTSQYFTP